MCVSFKEKFTNHRNLVSLVILGEFEEGIQKKDLKGMIVETSVVCYESAFSQILVPSNCSKFRVQMIRGILKYLSFKSQKPGFPVGREEKRKRLG